MLLLYGANTPCHGGGSSVCLVHIDLQHLELCMHFGLAWPLHASTGRDSAFISLRVSTHLCWQVLLQHLQCSATQQCLSFVASRATAGLCNQLVQSVTGAARCACAAFECIFDSNVHKMHMRRFALSATQAAAPASSSELCSTISFTCMCWSSPRFCRHAGPVLLIHYHLISIL